MIKVEIWTEMFGHVRIAFYEKYDGGIRIFNFYTGMVKQIENCEVCPEEYQLKIPHTIANELFESLAEALDSKGIKTDKDAKIQGTLEATKYHLEDMRKLLRI